MDILSLRPAGMFGGSVRGVPVFGRTASMPENAV
jgi:hypothetical protein